MHSSIPEFGVAIGENLIENLGILEGDVVSVEKYSGPVEQITKLKIEFNAPDFTPEDYPTKLENHKFIGKPYEGLVLAYGPPEYDHDWDPSFLMAFTV